MTSGDPRPLIGEPLSLDLLNTRWIDADGPRDLLDEPAGLARWLRSAGPADLRQPGEPVLAARIDQHNNATA
jgi:hypothetical protein